VAEDGLAGEARNAVTVATDLWDSWEDDAVVREVATSRKPGSRPDPRHRLPRPPQGRPVVFAPSDLVDADVALVPTPARAATAPRTFVELEIAIDTPDATGPPGSRRSAAGPTPTGRATRDPLQASSPG
jgi:hypothetical protein